MNAAVLKWSKPVISLLCGLNIAWVTIAISSRYVTLHYPVVFIILVTVMLYFFLIGFWGDIVEDLNKVRTAPKALRSMLILYVVGLLLNLFMGYLPATLFLHGACFFVGHITRTRHALSQGRALAQLSGTTLLLEILIQTGRFIMML